MTKKEFMKELAALLSKITEEERNDAINYYEDYFADAGIGDDMLVPASVGTPKQVADKIIGEAVYGEGPNQEDAEPKEVPVYYKNAQKDDTNKKSGTYYGGNSDNNYQYQKTEKDNSKLILFIVIAIITSPIWFSVLSGIAGILFGILAALGGMILGFGIGGIALIVTAFLSGSVAGGILLMGIGILLLAIAFVLIIPLVMYCGQFLPWLVKEIVKLVKKLLGKEEQVL